MAESLKQLRRRIRSVTNVRQITRAMEMVSAAKLRRAQASLMAARPYAAKLHELLGRLAASDSAAEHPLFQARQGGRATLVVFTADRGLCGAFNANMLSFIERFARDRGREGLELYCVGRKALGYFSKRGWPICGAAVDFSGNLDAGRSNALAAELIERYQTGRTDEVLLAYSEYRSTASFRPTIARYLSIEPSVFADAGPEAASEPEIRYIFEPSSADVFDSLLPRYLQSRVFIAFAEQFTSEHSARMLAMHNATQNCQELKDSITLRMNKARQATITRDLIDIVGGAEALKG